MYPYFKSTKLCVRKLHVRSYIYLIIYFDVFHSFINTLLTLYTILFIDSGIEYPVFKKHIETGRIHIFIFLNIYLWYCIRQKRWYILLFKMKAPWLYLQTHRTWSHFLSILCILFILALGIIRAKMERKVGDKTCNCILKKHLMY